ncbi:hypothetical protein NL676_030094 [Syzygium grande]|nr:hypothetical protein NL676_030094 [Syzygium grande]
MLAVIDTGHIGSSQPRVAFMRRRTHDVCRCMRARAASSDDVLPVNLLVLTNRFQCPISSSRVFQQIQQGPSSPSTSFHCALAKLKPLPRIAAAHPYRFLGELPAVSTIFLQVFGASFKHVSSNQNNKSTTTQELLLPLIRSGSWSPPCCWRHHREPPHS